MNLRRAPLILLLALGGALPVFAQSALYILDGEQTLKLVHKMQYRSAFITNPSPYDSAAGNVTPRYRLQPVEDYFPALVSVKIIRADFGRAGSASVRRLDQRFSFTAKFSSDYDLADVFFVLAFDTQSLEGKYYAQEITPAELRQEKAIAIEAPLPGDEKIEKYELHIFSRGVEVFNSGMGAATIDAALARKVAKRIKGVRNAPPKPFTGPRPRYPAALLATKATGRAVISCVIADDGHLQDVRVKDATNPAFSDAAVAVLPQWRFLPKVVDGHAVESAAELPFEFAPPKP